MILGTEYQAALDRRSALNLYCADLEDARRAAQELGRAKDVEAIRALIVATSQDYQDTQAVIDAHDRQESGREATRALSARARDRLSEQLMLAPRPHAIGVL